MSFWGNLQFSLFIFNLSICWAGIIKRIDRPIGRCPTGFVASYYPMGSLWTCSLWNASLCPRHSLFGLALLIFSWIETKREALQQRLQEQNASINLLLAENGNRIGQDLHNDTLGHVFTMLSIKAELVQTLLVQWTDWPGQRKRWQTFRPWLRTPCRRSARIVQSLKQHTVAEELQILQQMLDLAGVHLVVLGGKGSSACPSRTSWLWCWERLANNLLKHSQASKCRLVLKMTSKIGFTLRRQRCGLPSWLVRNCIPKGQVVNSERKFEFLSSGQAHPPVHPNSFEEVVEWESCRRRPSNAAGRPLSALGFQDAVEAVLQAENGGEPSFEKSQ